MKKLFSVVLLAAACISLSTSCNKPDPDPQGYYTCTCFITTTDTALHYVKLDTFSVHEDLMQKSLATSYCNSTQTANTDTLGRVAKCTIH